MKLKILLLIAVNIFLTVSAQAQTEAVMISDYRETTKENLKLLAEKTKKFAERLRKESATTRGFVIYYLNESSDGCKEKTKTKVEERIEFVKDQLFKKYKISPDKIVISADRFRNDTKVEFWIVPKGMREPRGEEGFFADCHCPDLRIITDLGMPFGNDEIVSFVAKINGFYPESINWSISAGEITDGQGTNVIKIKVAKKDVQEVIINLEVDYKNCCLESACLTKNSATIRIR